MFDKLRYNNCVSCKLNKIPPVIAVMQNGGSVFCVYKFGKKKKEEKKNEKNIHANS